MPGQDLFAGAMKRYCPDDCSSVKPSGKSSLQAWNVLNGQELYTALYDRLNAPVLCIRWSTTFQHDWRIYRDNMENNYVINTE